MSLTKSGLDSMIQGGDSPPEDWAALLRSPDRETLWFDAIKRREALNTYIRYVSTYPNLAVRIKALNSYIGKGSEALRDITASITQPLDLLSPVLGSKDSEEPVVKKLSVEWGRDQVVELEDRNQLEFDIGQKCSCHYEYKTENDWLESPFHWEVLLEDGPVTLIFFDRKLIGIPLEKALTDSSNKAILVLIPSKKE
jgi:hypothetical protein